MLENTRGWPPSSVSAGNMQRLFGLCRKGRLIEAKGLCKQLARHFPDDPKLLHLLGSLLNQTGECRAAVAALRRAIALTPDVALLHCNLAKALLACGSPRKAAAEFATAVALNPDYSYALSRLLECRHHLCDWGGIDRLRGRLVEAVRRGADSIDPFLFLLTGSDAALQLQCAVNYATGRFGATAPLPGCPKPSREAGHGRIRVGYLSAGFHQHATACLIAELLELHDRDRFQIHAYALSADDGGPYRRRIEAGTDCFHSLTTHTAVEAARRIRADRIDILVDLDGYTRHGRPEIAALRPAPVQVNYLGYPGSMGASFMDYIVVDRCIVPAQQQAAYSETPVFMPHCYQVNDRQRKIARLTGGRTSHGLPSTGFVFGAFNASYKITPEMWSAWMALLGAVPGSVLWLLEEHADTRRNLECEAGARGISPDRLVFAAKTGLVLHLARYRHVDLALDTAPVNGHTTTSDALWAGCPVVSCTGSSFVARVGGSLLHAIGAPELLARDAKQYSQIAIELARQPGELARIRRRIVKNRLVTPLFDTPRYTRQLEWAYQRMLQDSAGNHGRVALSIPEGV